MDVVTVLQRPEGLQRPVLLAAFRGWNDAGEAASGAIEVLGEALGASTFASIDAEEFFDFQATRPTVRIDEASRRVLDWPVNRFLVAQLPAADRHLVLLDGTEPNLRWRTFARAVVELAGELEVSTIVTLGALQVDVPHTRPVPITGVATDAALATRLGLRRSGYEGPTGITGVLNDAASAAGLDAMSMWAGVPHYLAGTAYLAGSLALAERVTTLLRVEVELGALAADALVQRDEIAQLVADDEDLAEYVTELEQRSDASGDAELPGAPMSGEQLAAELEQYLRDRDR